MKLIVRNTFARICMAALVLLIVGLTALDSLAVGQETKRVFVLNSYHRGYPFSDNAMLGIDDAFGKSGIKAETYVTYMDMKRIPITPQYFSKLKELIRVGYKGARFDAVIACDNDALEFMRKYRDELFPGVPVVFTGINDFDKRMLDGRSDITGISQSNDYAGTIRIAQKFRPATKDIVVVTDNTTTGMAHRSAIVKIRPDFPQSLGFTYLSLADMTLDELAEKLSKLNSDSIVLLLHHFVDRNGTGHSIQESTSLLAKSSSVPIFVVSDIRMGFGTLGGHLVGGYSQGEAAAQIAVKILGGTDVRTIPVLLESPNRFMFDYNVMKRFSIAEGDLPQGSIMINKPVSILEEYKPQLFAILGTFIVLSGILVYMLLEIRRRKRAEESLRNSESKYQFLAESMADVVFTLDINLVTTYVSPSIERMLGFTPEERQIQKVDQQLTPKSQELVFDTLVTELEREKKTGPDPDRSQTLELEYYHKDGSIKYLVTYIRGIRDSEGNLTGFYGSHHDITERKRAEDLLRESENRFKALAENIPGVIYLCLNDQYYSMLYLNDAVEQLTGYGKDDFLENRISFVNLYHPDDAPSIAPVVEQACERREPFHLIYRIRKRDGQWRWIEEYGVGIYSQGNLLFLEGFLTDITERKRAEAALRESETKYRALVETAGEAIFIAQEDIVKFCNKSFSHISGYALEDLNNMAFSDLVHPDDRQMVFERYNQRLEGKDVPSRYRFRFIDSRGNTRWADMSVALISWEGKPASLCLAADITELKQAEEALKQSEEKYRHLFERAVEGILVARGETLEFVNPALERILGHPLEKIISEPFITFIHPDDRAKIHDRHLKRMRGEPVKTGYDFRIIASDGAVKWLSINSQAIEWDGAPANLSFVTDISERIRAEEELRIFMESVENSSDAVGMSTPEGKHSYQNRAFDELFGPIGENPPDSVYVDPAVGHEVFRAIMAGGQWTGEVQMYAKDRRILDILLRAYANKDKSGRITALVGIQTDITERKRAEEEREKLQAQLNRAQKLESIGTLAGGVAHDFNNLLMGVQGHASLMMLGLDASDPHHVRLKHIEELVQSGADLTGQLLGFARGGRYAVRPTDMNEIVEKTSNMFGRTKKEITIYRQNRKDLWNVEADRTQMEQVLMNLYVNAWHAMPEGGEMTLETDNVLVNDKGMLALPPGRYVKITVSDTGTGMDAQTRERIFDPFFTTRAMGRGTGLGLATVYGIIQGHNGLIDVTSELGQGTTFEIYLPASDKAVVGEVTAEKEVLRGTETILLVDDEGMVMEVAREMLEYLGYRVHCVGSGQEAVAVYHEKKNEIDLVVLDMIMPGISGGETFARLREIDPQIKVLLSSGYSIDGQAREILDRGCNGFLQKPFKLANLSRKVREVLGD